MADSHYGGEPSGADSIAAKRKGPKETTGRTSVCRVQLAFRDLCRPGTGTERCRMRCKPVVSLQVGRALEIMGDERSYAADSKTGCFTSRACWKHSISPGERLVELWWAWATHSASRTTVP